MTEQPSSDVTRLLIDWSSGEEQAPARLMPLVYDELHRRAARYLQQERVNHPLQATALVHKAYLRWSIRNRCNGVTPCTSWRWGRGLAQVVELRFFGGMTNEEVAEYLGVSVPTVVRRWRSARAWLYSSLTGGETDGS